MILNDFAFAFRNIRRKKLLAAINVFGLSIGISACLVIFLIASYELSFDRFQPDRDRIYRVYTVHSGVANYVYSGIPTGVATAIRDEVTGIESLTNFHTCQWNVKVPEYAGLKDLGTYDKIIIAGPEYFEVFNYYHWVVGNPRQSLGEPFKVALSESRAKLYFGDLDPSSFIGKEIHYSDSLVVTVSGIFRDVTERTDLDFTDVVSFSTIEKSWLNKRIQLNAWHSINTSCQLFIKLHRDTDRKSIQEQIEKIPQRHETQHNLTNWSYPSKLQPFADLHFNTELGIFDGSRSVMEKSTLEILLLIAALLLIIASINFINLETAQASRRAKEVGVRKVLGSSRGKLIARFLSESFILCFFAVGLSIVWTDLAMKYFSEYIPQGLVLDITEPGVIIFLVSCLLVVTLLAGLYPAFILSSFEPSAALKDTTNLNRAATRSSFIRKCLTVFQFSFAQVLIVGTITISTQLRYMANKDLGFNPDAVIWVTTPAKGEQDKRATFQNALRQIPEVQAASINGMPPVGWGTVSSSAKFDNGKAEIEYPFNEKIGDTSYIAVYGIKLLAGRNLLPVDTLRQFLINETLMHNLGFTDPRDAVGKILDKNISIAGVVRDFHTGSLHLTIPPTVISYNSHGAGFAIKLFTPNNRTTDLKPAIAKVESAFKNSYPDEEFSYWFLDEQTKRFYETEERTAKLARAATGIAILISCLGLFGLSSFSVLQRTKEIGVRKVLGATVRNIWFLLSKEVLVLVLLACLLSAPIAYYVAGLWLERFAYRIDITVWLFGLSAIISLMVAFITISVRTIRAAQSDPVKALRYE
jgi:ABC-type antimicrobial peptide transport system permease subunit